MKKYQKNKFTRDVDSDLIRGIEWIDSGGKAVLDIGSGYSQNLDYLLYKGYKVMAVDKDPKVVEELNNRFKDEKNIKIQCTKIEEFTFKKYDLISGQNVFSFISKSDFKIVWDEMYKSLKPGGLLVGNVFGDKDGWNTEKRSGFHFYTRKEVDKLISIFEIIDFVEFENQGFDMHNRPKTWHLYKFILRKQIVS